MADSPLITGGRERVALEIYQYLRTSMPEKAGYADKVKQHLDLYNECLQAVLRNPYDASKLT